MSVFGQHIDLVVEFLQQLFTDVGVKHLFDSHLQIEVFAFVNRTKTAHRNLLAC